MLKNLKSLFIVEEEEETTAPDAKAPAAKASAATTQGAPAQNPPRPTSATPAAATPREKSARPSAPAGPASVNPAIVEKLLDAIDTNDLEGFDYLEYKRALKAMESLPMDEATKFRSAFATASTVGASLDKLTSSVAYYLHVLDKQRDDFAGVVQRELDAKVAGREAELAAIERKIEEKTAEIARLQSEIDQLRGKSGEVTLALQESRSKIETARAEFGASFEYVKSLFEQDAEKMGRYLK